MFFCEWFEKISAKPLFIGSIPIAASNKVNKFQSAAGRQSHFTICLCVRIVCGHRRFFVQAVRHVKGSDAQMSRADRASSIITSLALLVHHSVVLRVTALADTSLATAWMTYLSRGRRLTSTTCRTMELSPGPAEARR